MIPSPRAAARAERLFVAVMLPTDARDRLATALPPVLPGRRVLPDKWHFTLRFIGDTAASARERLIEALHEEAFGQPFTFSLTGLGGFPGISRARVLWAGVGRGAPRLRELASHVAHACKRVRLASDERPYSPHLTISRLDPPADLRRLISEHAPFDIPARVDEVVLMRSVLGGGPPRYESLVRYRLVTAR